MGGVGFGVGAGWLRGLRGLVGRNGSVGFGVGGGWLGGVARREVTVNAAGFWWRRGRVGRGRVEELVYGLINKYALFRAAMSHFPADVLHDAFDWTIAVVYQLLDDFVESKDLG